MRQLSLADRVPPLANAPLAATAHMGKLKGAARDDAAATGAHCC